jgi:hypothetical protein
MSRSLSRSSFNQPAGAHAVPGPHATRVPMRSAHPERARPAWTPHGPAHHSDLPPTRREMAMEDIHFRQLTTQEEIQSILHLRREINLTVADEAAFSALEKKETK